MCMSPHARNLSAQRFSAYDGQMVWARLTRRVTRMPPPLRQALQVPAQGSGGRSMATADICVCCGTAARSSQAALRIMVGAKLAARGRHVSDLPE